MGNGKISIILGGVLLFGIGTVPEAAPGSLRLRTAIERLGEEGLELLGEPGTARQYEELVDFTTRGQPFPVTCFTPVSGSLGGNAPDLTDSARQVLGTLAVRPRLPSPETYPVGNWLRIHATTQPESPHAIDPWDRNHNEVPDLVDQIAAAANSFFDIAGTDLGFPPPGLQADGTVVPYDLYLVRLPEPVHGFTIPSIAAAEPSAESPPGFLVIDPGDSHGRKNLRGIVAHQLAHAALFRFSSGMPAWWQEASAVWLEREITQDLAGYRSSLAERLRNPHLSLASDSLQLMQGAFLWPQYLVESTGNPFLIRSLWEEAALHQEVSPRVLTDLVLDRLNGGSFQESFLGFGLWNLYTGKRDDGNHYRYGSHFPDPAPPSQYDSYPAVARWEDTTVERLGTRLLSLEADTLRGGLEFHFFGEEGTPWQVAALVQSPGSPSRIFFQEVALDSRNQGTLRVPWDDAERVILVIQNLDPGPGLEHRIGFTSLLDPHYPFVLSGFGARGENGQIVLEWSSTREQDLLGWNIYRSGDPVRGFSRVNILLLPGGGDSRETTNYLFVDDDANPGRHYFYYLEGITLEGYSQRSHIVGGRSLPARESRSPRP